MSTLHDRVASPARHRSRSRGVLVFLLLGAVSLQLVFTAGTTAGASGGGGEDTTGQRYLPGVLGALNGLSARPDALAVARGASPQATTCKHYQGVARKDAPDGTPYLFITKSGNKSICVLDSDDPGSLMVARLGSRPTNGERMRSNVLPHGSARTSVHPEPLPTFSEDRVVRTLTFDGGALPAYHHPGGMQIAGDLLAVGADTPMDGEAVRATILFFKVADPANPVYLGRFDPPDLDGEANEEFGTDPVGLTMVRAADGTCCQYLLTAAGGPSNEEVRFYRSRPSSPGSSATDLSAGLPQWDEVGRYSESAIESCLGADWPTSGLVQGGQHQMLNFVREGGLDGRLYLLGGRRDGLIVNPFADEYLELYRVNLTSSGAPGACPLTFVSRKTVDTDAWGNEGTVSSFAAAGGVYVSPSGELIVYSIRHDTYVRFDFGPPPALLANHIPIGEYRSRGLARADSPTLRPTATVDGVFEVDEGSTVALAGSAAPPVTKAYVQLFEDDGAGLSLPGLFDSDQWLLIEYEDRQLDDFANLDRLGGDASDMWENAGSLRWFAPVGCTISLNDYPLQSTSWPGDSTVLLRGSGRMEEVFDLDNLPVYHPADEIWPVTPVPAGLTGATVGFDDDVEGVTFFHQAPLGGGTARRHSCQNYYEAAFGLGWDLDGDNAFESAGTTVDFSAAALDGPTTHTVRARAVHPTDTTPLGTGIPVPVRVVVRNVAPQVASAAVTDSLDRDLAGGSHVAIAGLPLRLAVDFTDPGVADTQTGRVVWGDGTVSTTFASFRQATGGMTGGLRDTHVFTEPGTYTIATTITDDDGGATTVEHTIEVVSLADAIGHVVDDLGSLIDQTSDPRIAAALRSALANLVGNVGARATNGALTHLEADDPVGAITKLRAAIGYLITAESLGAGDLSAMKDLLGLVAEGIATSEYQQAVTAFPSPSAGQAKALRTIAGLIETGHQQLVAQEYLVACDSFRQATDRSLRMK
jgi:hypothetical protein